MVLLQFRSFSAQLAGTAAVGGATTSVIFNIVLVTMFVTLTQPPHYQPPIAPEPRPRASDPAPGPIGWEITGKFSEIRKFTVRSGGCATARDLIVVECAMLVALCEELDKDTIILD